MSHLNRGDQDLHHHDGSHRWGGGPADPRGQAAYQIALQAHMSAPERTWRHGGRRQPVRRFLRTGWPGAVVLVILVVLAVL